MSSNRSQPEPLPNSASAASVPLTPSGELGNDAMPDYEGLVRFLVEPFLESPESLRVDCELMESKPKAWIRVAFDDPEKGRVFGRGGRNIQAIRTVLEATAKAAGQSIYLDIYDRNSRDRPGAEDSSRGKGSKPRSRRSSVEKPSARSRKPQ